MVITTKVRPTAPAPLKRTTTNNKLIDKTNKISPTLNSNNNNNNKSSNGSNSIPNSPPSKDKIIRRISNAPNKIKDAEGNINVVVRCR